eukprot:393280_1
MFMLLLVTQWFGAVCFGALLYENAGPIVPTKSKQLTSITLSDEMTIKLDVTIHSFPTKWQNIFVIGGDQSGERLPAIFLNGSPGDQVNGKVGLYFHDSMDNHHCFQGDFFSHLGKEKEVAYRINYYYSQSQIFIKINYVTQMDCSTFPGHGTLLGNRPVYVSDPAWDAADVTISNLQIYSGDYRIPKCPVGSITGVPLDMSDIPGCGLEHCDARSKISLIECGAKCKTDARCNGFTWDERDTICTIYKENTPNDAFNFGHQIFCVPTDNVCPLGSFQYGTNSVDNDIFGCGLDGETGCVNRVGLDIHGCYEKCMENSECVAFSFEEPGRLCSLYDTLTTNWDMPNQAFCGLAQLWPMSYDVSISQGTALTAGSQIVSADKRTTFKLQSDGNMVLKHFDIDTLQWELLWQSGTAGVDGHLFTLKLEDNGNLVLYRPDGGVVWHLSTGNAARTQYKPHSLAAQNKYFALRNNEEGAYYREPKINYPQMHCNLSPQGLDNDWRHDLDITGTAGLLFGVHSSYSDHHKDRVSSWTSCSTESSYFGYTDTIDLDITINGVRWHRGCDYVNQGNAALVGYDSHYEIDNHDRVFTWQCGNLEPDYRMVDCVWSGWTEYQKEFIYKCPTNKVMRGVWSEHSGWGGYWDRRFMFECCRLAVIDYDFYHVLSMWYLLHSCEGCSGQEYSVAEGIERSQTTEISETFSWSLEASLSVTQTFQYAVGSTEIALGITGTVSQDVTKTTSSSMTHSLSTESIFKCDKPYFYQWTSSAIQKIQSAKSTMSMHTGMFLCTNVKDPQCPVGFCLNDDCQKCKDVFTQAVDAGYVYLIPNNDVYVIGFPNNYWFAAAFVVIGIIIILIFLFCKRGGKNKYEKVSVESDVESDAENQVLVKYEKVSVESDVESDAENQVLVK